MQRKAEKEEQPQELKDAPAAVYLDRTLTVEEAKLRFLKAANDVSPFKGVREKPFISLGAAFLAGFGLSSLGASRSAPTGMAIVYQILGLLSQFAPFIIARARSSDG